MSNNIIEFYGVNEEDNVIITWVMDHGCNYNCKYCSTKYKVDIIEKDYISFLKFLEKIRNKYPEKNIILFLSGGEVTLWNKLEEFLVICNNKFENLYLNLTTNGSREIEWWKRIESLIHFADISYHPGQTNINHITEVLTLLSGRCTLQILMVPDKFDELYELGKNISEKTKNLVALKYVRKFHSDELYDYTERQMNILKRRAWFGDQYQKVFSFVGDQYFVVKKENNEIQKYNSLRTVFIERLNYWRGWKCWCGVDTFFVDYANNIYGASCRNRYIGNLNENYELPDGPTICRKRVCICLTDMIPRKVRPKKEYDLVLLDIPFSRLVPSTAPALLKSSVENSGFKCKVIDLNYELFKELDINENDFDSFTFDIIKRESATHKFFKLLIKKWVDKIKSLKPEWIGISVFSSGTSSKVVYSLCRILRYNFPEAKVIIGGHGITLSEMGKRLLEENSIDYYIKGEGEKSIVSLMRGENYIPGVNGVPFTQIANLDKIPTPDYSDTPPNKYPFKKSYVITSRGCTGRCNFCPRYYKRFKTRSAKLVVEEMIELYKKYNVNNYQFGDSTTNGKISYFRELLREIIKAKRKGLFYKDMYWLGFIRCLPRNIMTEAVYRDMSLSGARFINAGIENGSDKIRRDMNKRISNEDIYFMVEQCSKYKMELALGTIVGYYSETESNFQEHLALYTRIAQIDKNKMIIIRSGEPYSIDPRVDIDRFGLKIDDAGEWYYKQNTFLVRVRRWLRFIYHCKSLGLNIDITHSDKLLSKLENYKKTEEIKQLIFEVEHIKEEDINVKKI